METLTIGSEWVLKSQKENPWNKTTMRVEEIKGTWVRYALVHADLGVIGGDSSTVSSFLAIHIEVTP